LTGRDREGYAYRMMRPALLLSVALVGLAPGTARGTIILKLELPDLVGRADQIFVGKVVRVESRWGENRRQIVTDTTFRVERGVRGVAGGREVVVRHLGGVVGGIGMKISGTPSFGLGQTALVFTDRRGGHRYVTGMSQGAYPVSRDAAGRATVRPDLSELALARRSPRGELEVIKERTTAAPRLLESFLREIEATIARCEREKSRCQPR
jgi:hypothetical protein